MLHYLYESQIPLFGVTVLLWYISNHTNHKILNLIIPLGKRWKKLDENNFKQNLFRI